MNDTLFANPSIARRIYDSLDEQGYLPVIFPSGTWSIHPRLPVSNLLMVSSKAI